jgi:hypothetical protein
MYTVFWFNKQNEFEKTVLIFSVQRPCRHRRHGVRTAGSRAGPRQKPEGRGERLKGLSIQIEIFYEG